MDWNLLPRHAVSDGPVGSSIASNTHLDHCLGWVRRAVPPNPVFPNARAQKNFSVRPVHGPAIYTPCCCVPRISPKSYTAPLPTKDGGTLRTVLDARTYMLRLSKDRERNARWQRAAELLLAEADVTAFSKAVELTLFYDAILDVAAMA